jgi:hypothetical protein
MTEPMFVKDKDERRWHIIRSRSRRSGDDQRLYALCEANYGPPRYTSDADMREAVSRRQLCSECRKLAIVAKAAWEAAIP